MARGSGDEAAAVACACHRTGSFCGDRDSAGVSLLDQLQLSAVEFFGISTCRSGSSASCWNGPASSAPAAAAAVRLCNVQVGRQLTMDDHDDDANASCT